MKQIKDVVQTYNDRRSIIYKLSTKERQGIVGIGEYLDCADRSVQAHDNWILSCDKEIDKVRIVLGVMLILEIWLLIKNLMR